MSKNEGASRRFRPRLDLLETRTVPATILVNSNEDVVLGELHFTLREAINSINAGMNTSDIVASGTYGVNDEIVFAPFLSGTTITLNGTELPINNPLTITGLGADKLTINGANLSRIFNVNTASAAATISGLTLTGGNAGIQTGGAIQAVGNFTLRACTIRGNTGNAGGAMRFDASATGQLVQIIDSTISGNTCNDNSDGAGAGFSGVDVRILNSTFSGNSTPSTGGGFIFAGNGQLTVVNSTIVANSAGPGGGGMSVFAFGPAALLVNTIVAGNTGGDIFASPNPVTGFFNLIGDPATAGGLMDFTNGNRVGFFGGILPLDQIMNPALGFNGGPTQTHLLLFTSIAFDGGDLARATVDGQIGSTPLDFDQRGTGFARIENSNVDIGATERGPNTQPTANPGGPYDVYEGDTVFVGGFGSTDPDGDGTIVSFEWDLDYDGSTFDVDAVGITAIFDAANIDGLDTRTIGLRVTDDGGLTDIRTGTVVIHNAAPIITSITNTGPVGEGSLITVAVNTFDPAGFIADPGSYEFDFDNDGDYEVGPVGSNSAGAIYFDNGTYQVNVRVNDGDGGVTTGSTFVTVTNVNPTITSVINSGPALEGNGVSVTVLASDPAGVNDPLFYEFDFDNNGTYEVGPQATNGSFKVFGDNGAFHVNVRVTDGDGGSTTDFTIVSVTNLDPFILSVTDDGPVNEGSPVTITVDATDQGGINDPLLYEFDINNDGIYDYGPQSDNFVAHTFFDNGTYPINVRVTDDDGGFDLGTTTVTVNNTNPTITIVTNDGPVNEGSLVTVTVTATDPAGGNDPLVYEFDFDNDGTFEVGPQAGITATHTYPDNGTFTVNVRVTDGDGGVDTDSTTVIVNNVDPVIDSLTHSVPANEGSPVTVSVIATDVGGPSDPLLFEFDFDNDGTYEVGPQASDSASHTFADNGAFNVNVRVTDGDGGSATGTITVTVVNVDPTVNAGGNVDGVPFQPRDFTAGATDPSDADSLAGFDYNFNWDDGTPDTVVPATANNGAGITVTHSFTAIGTFNVIVTATDKNGGVSTQVTHQVVITRTLFNSGVVYFGGTNGVDKLSAKPSKKLPGTVDTMLNKERNLFAPVARIEAYGGPENDNFKISGKLNTPTVLHGGDGNDKLKGGNGPNILFGDAGDDSLTGGKDRDVLIGGLGIDKVNGKTGDDILVSAATLFDNDQASLDLIMAEWSRLDANYGTRVQHLNGTLAGGLNGLILLTPATVADDAAKDTLSGSGDDDWFLVGGNDVVKDDTTGAIVTLL